VGGDHDQWRSAAVALANGRAFADVWAARGDDVGVLASAGGAVGAEREGIEREGSSACICDGFGGVGLGLVQGFVGQSKGLRPGSF
jgi:hypothetical protein